MKTTLGGGVCAPDNRSASTEAHRTMKRRQRGLIMSKRETRTQPTREPRGWRGEQPRECGHSNDVCSAEINGALQPRAKKKSSLLMCQLIPDAAVLRMWVRVTKPLF